MEVRYILLLYVKTKQTNISGEYDVQLCLFVFFFSFFHDTYYSWYVDCSFPRARACVSPYVVICNSVIDNDLFEANDYTPTGAINNRSHRGSLDSRLEQVTTYVVVLVLTFTRIEPLSTTARAFCSGTDYVYRTESENCKISETKISSLKEERLKSHAIIEYYIAVEKSISSFTR